MTLAGIVILTVVITLSLVAIGIMIYQARKKGEKGIPWDKVRPIVREVIDIAIEVKEKDSMGYEALEIYAVDYIKTRIDNADFLQLEEKAVLTKTIIRSLIRPTLQDLYNKEV